MRLSNTTSIATEVYPEEIAMNRTRTFAAQSPIAAVAAAVLASVISLGMLSAVAYMFQRDGKPLQRLAAAERVCAHYVYHSERQACMNDWLAASQPGHVAARPCAPVNRFMKLGQSRLPATAAAVRYQSFAKAARYIDFEA